MKTNMGWRQQTVRLLLAGWVCFGSVGTSNAQPALSAGDHGLDGDVYAAMQYVSEFERKFGEMQQQPEQKDRLLVFGPDGLLRFEAEFHEGETREYYDRYYYENGQVVRRDHHLFGDLWSVSIFETNSEGLVSQVDEYNKSTGELNQRRRYQYDNHGNVVQQVTYGPDGDLMDWGRDFEEYSWVLPSAVVKEFDDQNRLVKVTRYLHDETVYEVESHEYDHGISRTTITDGQGDVIQSYERHYDDRGNPTELIEYDASQDIISRTAWNYDGERNPTNRVVYNAVGRVIAETEFDDSGNVVLKTRFNDAGSPIEQIEYQYDQQGNWVQAFRKEAEEHLGVTELVPVSITRREITYRQ